MTIICCTGVGTSAPQPVRKQRIALRSGLSIGWISTLLIAGCDPVISVAGANFPVWLMCLVAGILVSLCLRPVFVATGIDRMDGAAAPGLFVPCADDCLPLLAGALEMSPKGNPHAAAG